MIGAPAGTSQDSGVGQAHPLQHGSLGRRGEPLPSTHTSLKNKTEELKKAFQRVSGCLGTRLLSPRFPSFYVNRAQTPKDAPRITETCTNEAERRIPKDGKLLWARLGRADL